MATCPDSALLTVAEMATADRFAIDSGIPGVELMANAGGAVADAIEARWSPRPCLVLCGPGNNGGDGFVAAERLAAHGWPIRLALLGPRDGLEGDAAAHAAKWRGEVADLDPALVDEADLVVDALFGAGLSRPLEGPALAAVERIVAFDKTCVAVDVPSGVDGDTGEIRGAAPRCALTVTFFTAKPGHLLLPGRLHCGELVVADIGIPGEALAAHPPALFRNRPALWMDHFRWPRPEDHKYARGHTVIAAGAEMTGAARLAARGALRMGSGLVSVACPRASFPIYAAALTAGIIVRPIDGPADYARLIGDRRVSALLVGPGNGVDLGTRATAKAALATAKPCILDADALTVFADAPTELFESIRGPSVMTPHDGEFVRLFDHGGDRLSRARAAAGEAGAVIVSKGFDTIVAAPDGRAAITENASADLATAGAGDVLSGLIAGLLAQGMPAFEAAAAAVWLHAEAGSEFGPGLIADDLPDLLPDVLFRLRHALADD